MISETEATNEILRLRGFPRFDQLGEQGQAELVKALQQASQSAEHGRAVVQEIVETYRLMPVPADVYEVAARLRREESAADDCQFCLGSGWMQIKRGEYTAVDRCPHCVRGRQLQAAAAAAAVEQKAEDPKPRKNSRVQRAIESDWKQAAGGER
jgi:hypothetical protein